MHMDGFSLLAGLFALTIIISRGSMLLWPGKARKMIKELAAQSPSRSTTLAAVFLASGVTAILLLLTQLNVQTIMIAFFAFSMLTASWFFFHPDLIKSFDAFLYKQTDTWIRLRALLAVVIALIVLYAILR